MYLAHKSNMKNFYCELSLCLFVFCKKVSSTNGIKWCHIRGYTLLMNPKLYFINKKNTGLGSLVWVTG